MCVVVKIFGTIFKTSEPEEWELNGMLATRIFIGAWTPLIFWRGGGGGGGGGPKSSIHWIPPNMVSPIIIYGENPGND